MDHAELSFCIPGDCMDLKDFFTEYTETALAFSGGVDSAYLLYAAAQYAKRVAAYYVKSAFQPQFELEDAMRLAGELNVKMKVINLDILADEKIAANPDERCYYCKKKIFGAIIREALADDFKVIIDGTNASDDIDERPGIRALHEMSVLSPLRLCNLTKTEIRRLSKGAGLFTWDKPAYACLATRIPSGQLLTEPLLKRTERAEDYLSSLGFVDFRIRSFGETAKIQITEKQLALLLENREEILKRLSGDYGSVCLDLEVRSEQ